MSVRRTIIADNLARVHERVAAAAKRSGRLPSEVTLVAVSKYVDVADAAALIECGCHDLGESRPQELWKKAEQLAQQFPNVPLRWHVIGHLQRNKARRTLPLAALIHSADNLALLQELNTMSASLSRRTRVLLEVNVSHDANKHGFSPDELPTLLPQLLSLTALEISGLMTMSGLESDDIQTRREFAALRELRNHLQTIVPSNIVLHQLSMGMSGDFEIAIEEGATLVRVGSALFEGLPT